MKTLLLPAATALLVSFALAHAKTTKHEAGSAEQEPAAQTTALPPDPVAMQKWFGKAVGDILTDADHALNPPPAKAR